MEGMGLGILDAVGGIVSSGISNEWEKEASREQYLRQLVLSGQNAGLALQNWERTSFAAQRAQMEKAGLSVGLMYKQGGGQGVSSTPPGQISKRNVVPMDVQGAMQTAIATEQLKLQKQQIEANVNNTNADTELKKIDAGQKTGVDLQTKEATLENIKQQTENKAIESNILTYEQEMKRIEQNIAQETEKDIVYQAKANASKLMDEARSAYAKANIDQTTQKTQIEMIKQNAREQVLRMGIMKLSGDKIVMETDETRREIRKLDQEIQKVIAETENIDQKTANEKKQIILNQIANDFMYGDEAKAIRLWQMYWNTFKGL